jgi:hypothetical protein
MAEGGGEEVHVELVDAHDTWAAYLGARGHELPQHPGTSWLPVSYGRQGVTVDEARAEVQRWHTSVVSRQMSVLDPLPLRRPASAAASGAATTASAPQTPLYRLDLDNLTVEDMTFPGSNVGSVVSVPLLAREPGFYMDGSRVEEGDPQELLFHGTRDSLVGLILRSGLHCSPESHGEVGVWLSTGKEWALTWATTPCERFAGCAIMVRARSACLKTNRKIRGGICLPSDTEPTRYVAIPANAGGQPQLQLVQLCLILPSEAHTEFVGPLVRRVVGAHAPMRGPPSTRAVGAAAQLCL